MKHTNKVCFSAEMRDDMKINSLNIHLNRYPRRHDILFYEFATDFGQLENIYSVAPALNTTDFSFLAIGDSRSGLSWNQNKHSADFTIFNGDVDYAERKPQSGTIGLITEKRLLIIIWFSML
jgi:hypothetical protein